MEKGTLQKAYEKLVLDNLELEERIKKLKAEKENLRQYASGLENAQNLITVRYRELEERLAELKIENAKLNIILYHRENGLSHADFKAELEISKQSERIEELKAQLEEEFSRGVKEGLNQAAEIVKSC